MDPGNDPGPMSNAHTNAKIATPTRNVYMAGRIEVTVAG
jgi:hypothetical protein